MAGRAAAKFVDLLGIVRAVGVDHELLHKVFTLCLNDFEGAVQAVCALEIGADYIITRSQAICRADDPCHESRRAPVRPGKEVSAAKR